MSMLQYKNVWGGGNDPVPSIRNDFEYVNWRPRDSFSSFQALSLSGFRPSISIRYGYVRTQLASDGFIVEIVQ